MWTGRAGRRLTVLLTIAMLGGACASPTPPTVGPSVAIPAPTDAAPLPSDDSTPSGGVVAGPSDAPAPSDPLTGADDPLAIVPADLRADVDALAAATTREAAVEATRTILQRAGVVVTNQVDGLPATPASIYLTEHELLLLADEATSGTPIARATLDDFAAAFVGTAGLPPNEHLLDTLATIDVSPAEVGPTPSAEPNATDLQPIQADTGAAGAHIAQAISAWVAFAVANHDATDPDVAALTVAPLYLQAFAGRQGVPVDLRAPFSARDLHLGMLQITILVAGLRSMLVAAAPAAAAAGGSPLGAPTTDRPGAGLGPRVAQTEQELRDCDDLKHNIDAHIPLSIPLGLAGKGFFKDMIKGFIDGLFGAGTNLAKAVSPAFTSLGLLFRVAAVVMLYEHAVAKLELKPAFIHKPIGQNGQVAAELTAGIPDAEWAAAKAEREADPFGVALKTCAKILGIPVTKDLIDVGEGLKGWKVEWQITRGVGSIVRFRAEDFLGSGAVASRYERPLTKKDDHSGKDAVPVVVLPEKDTDHPGKEYSDPVEVCAHVLPKEPPGGFKSLLSAGMAGKSLAGGGVSGIFSLVSLIGDLMTAWYRAVSPINACATMNVTYHVPQPGKWHGRITVETDVRESISTSIVGTRDDYVEHSTSTDTTALDVRDTYYVSGDDSGFGDTTLQGYGVTYGVGTIAYEREGVFWTHSGCRYSKAEDGTFSGSWDLRGDTTVSIVLLPDGTYQLSWGGVYSTDPDLGKLPGEDNKVIAILSGNCTGEVDESRPGAMYASPTTASVGASFVKGTWDPFKPGDRLKGRVEVPSTDPRQTTTVTWDLQHDGPIQVPQP